jgi:hypothetical protein
LTNQEIFNTVVTALRKQGKHAGVFDADGDIIECRYRDEFGNKCAAGHIISDHLYNENMEGVSFQYSVFAGRPSEPFIPVCNELGLDSTNINFIGHLQSIHDDHSVDEWEYQWGELAKNFNLEMPVLRTE